MTDNEIIKALECRVQICTDPLFIPKCDVCANYDGFFGCRTRGLIKETVAILTRQKAEIERLQTECGNTSVLWKNHYESIFESAKETVRSEAIKEFVESAKVYKIKGEFAQRDDYYVNVVNIEQLAEMECERLSK